MFLFFKLPSAFFSGVMVQDVNELKCVTSVPYKWFSQNPFRSTYFACLAMAAEMSTGILALAHVHKRNPPVSMLVVKLEANYFKKATGLTRFTCSNGMEIKSIIELAITSGEAQTFKACSIGTNSQGETVAEFFITWSFKTKSSRPVN